MKLKSKQVKISEKIHTKSDGFESGLEKEIQKIAEDKFIEDLARTFVFMARSTINLKNDNIKT